MISRSARVAAFRRSRLARRGCGRGRLAGALGATVGSFLLEFGLLGRQQRDLRRASFSGTAPGSCRCCGHRHLVLGSHLSPSVVPDVCVGHDSRVPAPGSGIGIRPAAASGSERGAFSGLNRRYPMASARSARGCRCSPHVGHAVRYAAVAGVNRIRQPAQHAWVIGDHPTCRLARNFCVAVAMANRLSALLAENIAREARRAGLSERTPSLPESDCRSRDYAGAW
jgi:hypothetical protein